MLYVCEASMSLVSVNLEKEVTRKLILSWRNVIWRFVGVGVEIMNSCDIAVQLKFLLLKKQNL